MAIGSSVGDFELEAEHESGVGGKFGEVFGGALGRVASDRSIAGGANHLADAGEEEAQVVVDFGRGADGGAIGSAGVAVGDGDRGRDAVDQLGLGLVELFEELPRVGGEAFDVAPLPFGVERVEGEAGFAAAGDAADRDQPAMRQIEIDPPQVVDGHATESDDGLAHRVTPKRRLLPADESDGVANPVSYGKWVAAATVGEFAAGGVPCPARSLFWYNFWCVVRYATIQEIGESVLCAADRGGDRVRGDGGRVLRDGVSGAGGGEGGRSRLRRSIR